MAIFHDSPEMLGNFDVHFVQRMSTFCVATFHILRCGSERISVNSSGMAADGEPGCGTIHVVLLSLQVEASSRPAGGVAYIGPASTHTYLSAVSGVVGVSVCKM